MYRSAARRLLPAAFRRGPVRSGSPAPFPAPILHRASYSTGTVENAQSPKTDNAAAFNSSSSSSSTDEGRNPRATARPKAHWQEQQARVLQASLRHVVRFSPTQFLSSNWTICIHCLPRICIICEKIGSCSLIFTVFSDKCMRHNSD